jgi:hypothetical protein
MLAEGSGVDVDPPSRETPADEGLGVRVGVRAGEAVGLGDAAGIFARSSSSSRFSSA